MNKDSSSIHPLFTSISDVHSVIARILKLLHKPRSSIPQILLERASLWLLILFPLAPCSSETFAATLKIGESFPDLASFTLEGRLPDMKDKVLLIDFFASWCAPCHESFPVMQQLHKQYGEKGVVIIAISVDKKKADLERFLRKHSPDFAVLRDESGRLAAELKIPTMPTSFLVGRDGKISGIHDGFHGDQTRKKYVSEIEALLK